MDFTHYLAQADAVAWVVALTLLLMSVSAWVVIVLKILALGSARTSVARALVAFWQNGAPQDAQLAAQAFDKGQWLQPLLAVMNEPNPVGDESTQRKSARYTRLLREAKNQTQTRLEFGQVVLATVGSTAPFVGLLGTVWGIYHALFSIAGAGVITIDKVAGPVGEALVMTAAGLAVALPAVLAYNVFNRQISQIMALIDGFAYDLRELLAE
jgi:biopolymer transport protein ExbB